MTDVKYEYLCHVRENPVGGQVTLGEQDHFHATVCIGLHRYLTNNTFGRYKPQCFMCKIAVL